MTLDIARIRRETELLTTAAQPGPDDFERLRAEGFEAVVNLSTPTARNYLHDEARRALDAGLLYAHVPIDCSALRPLQYEMVRGALDSLTGRRVLLHCAGNVKSSAMAHIYRVRELGEPVDTLRDALRAQDWHEPKWFAYFDAMGA